MQVLAVSMHVARASDVLAFLICIWVWPCCASEEGDLKLPHFGDFCGIEVGQGRNLRKGRKRRHLRRVLLSP
jgi:hypothetical protein